jgi:hypothetical protein
MAKKKPTPRKRQTATVLTRIQGGIAKMRRDAEGLLKRARREASRLSGEQKRALDRAVGEVKKLRSDFEKVVKRTSKDVEARSKRLLSTLEKEAEKRLEPIVGRLTGPSRQEIQSLARRVQHLERLVKEHSHAAPPAPTTESTPSSTDAPQVG